jgi:hypothetical protein
MTERGLNNDELELQLQEEEKRMEQWEPTKEAEVETTPEATIETSNEQMEKEIEFEANKAESNEKVLKENLAAVGGEEGLRATWNTISDEKKAAYQAMTQYKDLSARKNEEAEGSLNWSLAAVGVSTIAALVGAMFNASDLAEGIIAGLPLLITVTKGIEYISVKRDAKRYDKTAKVQQGYYEEAV